MLRTNLGNGFVYGRAIKDDIMVMLLESELNERELALIINAMEYAESDCQGGLPGHNLLLLISKLLYIMQVNKSNVKTALDNVKVSQEVYDDTFEW